MVILSPVAFASLSRLAHLTELKLKRVKLNLATLDRAHLEPLPGVRRFTLDLFAFEALDGVEDEAYYGNAFCRIISHLFPNAKKFLKFDQVTLAC